MYIYIYYAQGGSKIFLKNFRRDKESEESFVNYMKGL